MKLTLVFSLLCVFCGFAANVNSQTTRVNIQVKNVQIKDVLIQIEEQTDYLFVYNHENVDLSNKVSLQVSNTPVYDVLGTLFGETDLTYAMEGSNILLMKSDRTSNLQQAVVKISGIVTDEHRETIIGANIVEKGTTNGTITDIDGNFTLDVSAGAILVVTYVGYTPLEIPVGNRTRFDIILAEDSETLESSRSRIRYTEKSNSDRSDLLREKFGYSGF